MKRYRDKKTDQLGDALCRQLDQELRRPDLTDEELFSFAEFDASAAERGGYSNYSYWSATVRAFLRDKVAVFFLVLMVALLAFTFIQPFLPGQMDPLTIHYDESGRVLQNLSPGEEGFLFGTNEIGQDIWARIWSGTRTSLLIGFVVACVEAVVGIFMGVLWGYVRKLDFLFTELYNVLDNIPQTLLLILFSYILMPGVDTIIFALCLTGWLGMPGSSATRWSSSGTGTTTWPPGVWAPPSGASSSATCCPIWCRSSPCAWPWPSPPPSATRSLSPTSASACR